MVTIPNLDPTLLASIIEQLPATWSPADESKPTVVGEVERLQELIADAQRHPGPLGSMSPDTAYQILLCTVYSRGMLAGYNYALTEQQS